MKFHSYVSYGSGNGYIEICKSSLGFQNVVWTKSFIPVTGFNAVDMSTGTGDSYSLNAGELFTLRFRADDWTVYYTDFELNTYPDGVLLDPTGYTLRIDQLYTCDIFFWVTMNGAPLSIKFSKHFDARIIRNHAELTWSSLGEINNAGFEIERSADGIEFVKIGWVNEHGNSNEEIEYTFVDKDPLLGKNYYRLRQVDYDGRFEYSKIVSLQMEVNDLSIFPNPASDLIQISGVKEDFIYIISDINGHIIRYGITTEKSLMISDLSVGIYLLKIQRNGKTIYHKLMKVR